MKHEFGKVGSFRGENKVLISQDPVCRMKLPMSNEAGAMFGSGSINVFDDTNCMVDLAYWVAAFFPS
jgi:NADH:ubiquinone oxidoreductase subunit F (NADH-binding)